VTAPTLYKVLGADGQPIHGGTGVWHLPNGKPGRWMPKIGDPKCCERGYHLVGLAYLPEWLAAGCTIFEAEGRGPSDSDDGKTAFAQARLLRQVYLSDRDWRLFAADCAEHVLPIFERMFLGDDRPRKAIKAARAYARGDIGSAARAAGAAAAADAARAAALAAARAAGDAARAAAWDAAWDAERQWQAERLATYLTLDAQT
jgi:Imm-5 like putative immunity protein